MLHRSFRAEIAAFVLGVGACVGTIQGPDGDRAEPGARPGGSLAGEAAKAAGTTQTVAASLTRADAPRLLPFAARVSRVAALLGKDVDDALFATLQANRTALGDYDYGRGIKPDGLWSAARVTLWVKSLLPVCGSPAWMAAYPNAGKDPRPLLEAAYGRSVNDDEVGALTSGVAGLGAEAADRTTCLAVLSSLEFVSR